MYTSIIILILLAFAFIVYKYAKISDRNDQKLVSILDELRRETASSDSIFPIIFSDTPSPGIAINVPFEMRTMVSYKNGWQVLIVTPAGVQKKSTIKPEDLTIINPKKAEDFSVGIAFSSPVGFVSPRYVTASEDITLYPMKKSYEETQKIVQAFIEHGATLSNKL